MSLNVNFLSHNLYKYFKFYLSFLHRLIVNFIFHPKYFIFQPKNLFSVPFVYFFLSQIPIFSSETHFLSQHFNFLSHNFHFQLTELWDMFRIPLVSFCMLRRLLYVPKIIFHPKFWFSAQSFIFCP